MGLYPMDTGMERMSVRILAHARTLVAGNIHMSGYCISCGSCTGSRERSRAVLSDTCQASRVMTRSNMTMDRSRTVVVSIFFSIIPICSPNIL